MNDNELDILTEHGYVAGVFQIDDASQLQLIPSRHDYYFHDSAAFASGARTYMRDPTVSLSVLEFAVEEPSPLAAIFAAELVKVLAPSDRLLKRHIRPLVRTTPTTVHAIYRSDTTPASLYDQYGPMFEYGLAIPDSDPYAIARLHGGGNVPVAGDWLDERSPLTVKRDALPEWNGEETAKKLRALVDRFIAAGEIRERGPYAPPPKVYERVELDPNRINYADPAVQRALGFTPD